MTSVLIRIELKKGTGRNDLDGLSWSQLTDVIQSWDFEDHEPIDESEDEGDEDE